MRTMLTFVCPELDVTYDAIYRELALFLEMPVEETLVRFSPDDAVSRLKYHRRQARRREVFTALAGELGVDETSVYAACTVDGATTLLAAVRSRG
jgi:hypothetical protein